jgi:hypothetical protein
MWLRVALLIQRATRMRRIACGLSGPIILFDISQTARFSEKKVIEYKMCVLNFSTN